jgi:hypothetical protein
MKRFLSFFSLFIVLSSAQAMLFETNQQKEKYTLLNSIFGENYYAPFYSLAGTDALI